MALGAIGLDVGTKNDDMDNADLVFGFSGGGFNIGSYLSASGVWNPIPGLTGVDLMNATDSVYYYSLTQGDVNWSLTPSLQGY